MTLSRRSATQLVSWFLSPLAGWRRITAPLLFLAFVFLPLPAEAGLPRAAVSIPTGQSLAAGMRAAEECDVPGKVIVLPGVALDLGGAESPASALAEQAEAVRGMPEGSEVWLHVDVGAGRLSGNESEKQITDQVDAFLKRMLFSAPALRGLIVEVKGSLAESDRFAFGMVRLALAVKAMNSGLRVAFVFPSGFVARQGGVVKRLATYSDLLGTTYSESWRQDAAWIAEHALNKPLILRLDSETSASASTFLKATLSTSGTSTEIVWSEPADARAADAVCAVNRFMAHSIPENMFPAEAATSAFRVAVDGVASGEHRWFGGQSDQVIVARVNGSPGTPKTVRLEGAGAGPFEIAWYDPATGAGLAAGEVTKSDKGLLQTCECTSEYALISIHKQSEAGQTAFNTVEVKGGVDLKIEEVIARWQQNREAQKQKLENYVASSFMSLHFESTNLGPGFDVSMQLKQFFSRTGPMELAQKEFYVNGVKFGKNHAFPLPQIEPEKVLTQPLELKLNERYDYKLLGTEQINGALCYVVGVEPKVRDEALYSGKIWIDGTTFREVRQSLSQRGAKSNVLVNTETQNFELVADGKGNRFNLLRSVSAQQLLNAAGRDFVVQRTVQFSEYVINAPEFSSALAAEHSSDDPMFRDTDQGLRSLKRQGNERVLVDKSVKRIESLIAGAMYGGTFNFPIPFLGISIADFDFRHTGAQLSTFFAGPILVTDLSKQYRPKFRLALDLALNGLPGENRTYSNNTELVQGQVWTWEQTTGLRASWQASTHLSVTASTYFAYDNFLRTSDADEAYELPRNGLTVLPGVEIKYNRKGYVFDAQGTRGERVNWRPFGCTSLALPPAGCGSLLTNPPPQNTLLVQSPQTAYTLYNADLNKDYYLGKFTKGGWDLSYWGGDQLDRWSRYFPSFLSAPRLHGIPPGTDSFDAIAAANVHYGFNVMDFMKIDGMYSYARARNLDESFKFRKFDGLELNFNTPGPFGMLMQGTVSYALDGNIARYNSRWAAYVLIFKPLH